jgi:hypothetical protein
MLSPVTDYDSELPDLWSLKQVAAYYRVHVSTGYRWIRRGYFPNLQEFRQPPVVSIGSAGGFRSLLSKL